jgi:hypothetical protein
MISFSRLFNERYASGEKKCMARRNAWREEMHGEKKCMARRNAWREEMHGEKKCKARLAFGCHLPNWRLGTLWYVMTSDVASFTPAPLVSPEELFSISL